MMRIILVGQGPFGEKVFKALIKRGEEIVAVFSPPDKRGEAMKNLAEGSKVSFYRPKQMKAPEVYETFKKLDPDLVILAFVTDILPERLLGLPTLGTICYHPSLLPRHRGASGINWAIIQGDTRTGLTILWADKGIDTGPILLQKEVEIGPDDTTGSLYFNILFPMGIEAINEAVELIKKGKAPRIPQDESKATYEPPCDDRVASIDFEKSVRDIYNLVRGCDPQPGAYTSFKGKKVRFYDARMEPSESGKKPGEVLGIDTDSLTVAVKGGFLKIGKVRVDKGEKIGPMEFAGLVDARVGDRLGR
jgi:methionyl-tRNA formyltransferase